MAKNEIVKRQENNGIKIFAPAEAEDKFVGIPTSSSFLPVFKHNYNGGCFDVPDEPPRIGEFDALIIHLQDGLRRNFETIFKQGVVVPPTCYSVDGVHGSRAREIRDFKAVGRKSIYGECKTCFYSQFKTAGAWQDQGEFGKGVQCANYLLAFLLQVIQHPEFDENTGEVLRSGLYRPIVLQVPPTSVSVISWNLGNWITKSPGATIFNVVWKFIGTGGTKPRSQSSNAINVILQRGALPDEVKNLKELQSTMQQQFVDISQRFASGGDISGPAENSEKVEDAVAGIGSAEI